MLKAITIWWSAIKGSLSLIVLAGFMGVPAFSQTERNVTSDIFVSYNESLPVPVINALAVFTKEVRKRTLSPNVASSQIKRVIRLSVGESLLPAGLAKDVLKEDGYYIKADSSGVILHSRNAGGAVAGLGRLLRLMDFTKQSIAIPAVTLMENPAIKIRGMYFATHFNNYYECATVEEVNAYVEDLALWGCNSILVWFDPEKYTGFDDPKAAGFIERLRQIEQTAHKLGMRFGLTGIANDAFTSSPKAIRSPKPSKISRDFYICPYLPGALEYEEDFYTKLLDRIQNVDFLVIWAYDPGGCDCELCAPYAGNGYIKASERIAKVFKQKNLKGSVYLSAWYIDRSSFDPYKGNVEKFCEYLKTDKASWVDGVLFQMSPYHATLPNSVIKAGVDTQKHPLFSFMDISMAEMAPWGGYGANPMGNYVASACDLFATFSDGGWPYSEGIYEDVNKSLWFQKCANPKLGVADTYKEYARLYYGSDVADKAAQLLALLEKTHKRQKWKVVNLKESGSAWELAQQIDLEIAPWAKDSWRWRIVYLRAAIDNCINTTGVQTKDGQEKIKPYLDEIVKIYHAELIRIIPASADLRPPTLPKLDQ